MQIAELNRAIRFYRILEIDMRYVSSIFYPSTNKVSEKRFVINVICFPSLLLSPDKS